MPGSRPVGLLSWTAVAALVGAVAGGVATSGSSAAPATWRSELYPSDWQPGDSAEEGAFLPDFSYAGYRNGEQWPPVRPAGPVFDVVGEFGGDPTGTSDTTAALQAAVDAAEAAGGGDVFLPAGTYRLDDLIRVDGRGVVIRGSGTDQTYVVGTRDFAMTDRATFEFHGAVSFGAHLPLVEDGAQRATSVRLADATSLSPGDEVSVGWTITEEFIAEHGMTGTWQAFNGTWRPFFRRRVTAIDTTTTPHTVTLDIPLRYPAKVRDGASIRVETGHLTECGIESLSVCNAVDRAAAWSFDRAHAIELDGGAAGGGGGGGAAPRRGAGPRRRLQSGGILVASSRRVTVEHCVMARAQNRGGGGNGYLFEVSRSGEVLFRDCEARDGRHNFIQNWGFGTTGCVFLRCWSRGSRAYFSEQDPVGFPAYCEYHHSLATANLVDSCRLEDGWYGGNRGTQSSGAGHSVTGSVYWNLTGGGLLRSFQFGEGLVIGPGDLNVITTLDPLGSLGAAEGTAPEDRVERGPDGAALQPTSLYDDQLARRLGTALAAALTPSRGLLLDDDRPGRDRLAVRLAFDPPVPFDPATDDWSVRLEGPGWAESLEIAAADPGWRTGRRKARWRSPNDAVPRVRVTVRLKDGRARLRIDRLDLAASPANPVDVTVAYAGQSASDSRAWSSPRRARRHDVVRLRAR